MNVFDLSAKITMDINGYLKNMDTAQAVAMSTMGVIGGAVSDFMGKSIEAGKNFDSSISQVAATMGGTMSDLETQVGSVDTAFGEFDGNLREYAKFMGQNTAFSATQAADALNYMALAGYDTQTSMNMLPNVLNLAAAGSMDLARASDMVTDTQTAFGISGRRTTQMVDEMAKAASTGNTSVEQLGDAFLVVGGLAGELNGGMVTLSDGTTAVTDGVQELEIALTAMANAGVKGSEAGTHMRNMLLKLSSPTKEGADQMEALGVNVFDAEGNMRSLREIMGDLNTALSTLTQGEKIQAISELFNSRDLASAEALLAAVEQDWDGIGESILDAQGSAQKMADTQLDNLQGDITLFNSALEGMQIAISDSATPALRELTQFGTNLITELTHGFESLPEPMQTVIGMFGLVGSKALELTPMISSFTNSINLARIASNTAAKGAEAAAGGFSLMNPVLIAIAGTIALLTGSLAAVREQIEKNNEAIKATGEEVNTFYEGVQGAKEGLQDMAEGGLTAANAAKNLAEAQAHLETLQNAGNETTKKSAELEDSLAESLLNAKLTMTGAAESGNVFYDVMDAMTGGALRLYAGVESAKEATDEYVESSDQLVQATFDANAQRLEANNLIDANTLLLSEMTDNERLATEEILNSVSASENSREAYTSLTGAIADLNTEHQNAIAGIQETQAQIEAEKATLEAALESAKESVGTALDTVFDGFSKVSVEANQSITEMIEGLNSQLDYMKTYGDNLSWLMEQGVSEGLVMKLADGSTESAAILQGLVEDGGAHIQELSSKFDEVETMKETFSDRMSLIVTDFDDKMDDLDRRAAEAAEQLNKADEAYDSGINTINGFILGAEAGRSGIIEEYQSLGTSAINAFRRALNEHSPSKIFETSGRNTILGAIIGAEGERRNLERTYESLATAAINAYDGQTVEASVSETTDWKRAGSIAAQIPRSDARETPQKPVLVLDGQIIGQLLAPYITAEIQRVGVNLAGGMG